MIRSCIVRMIYVAVFISVLPIPVHSKGKPFELMYGYISKASGDFIGSKYFWWDEDVPMPADLEEFEAYLGGLPDVNSVKMRDKGFILTFDDQEDSGAEFKKRLEQVLDIQLFGGTGKGEIRDIKFKYNQRNLPNY